MKGSAVRQPRPVTAQPAKATTVEEPRRNEFVEWIKSLGIAVALFLVIRTFLIQAYTIPSGSMEETLLIGDYLMANNAIYGARVPFTDFHIPAIREPRHGDIVVFRPDYNDPVIDVVKRLVGEPGDTIQMIDRVVYRNGEALEESYLEPTYLPDEPLHVGGVPVSWHSRFLPSSVDASDYRPTRDNWGPLIVPEHQYMLLGDNRDQSLDSRYMGFIPREVIRGKAMFIYFSVNKEIFSPFPRFITAARWNRIGDVIR